MEWERLLKKSVWNGTQRGTWFREAAAPFRFYCPQCKSARFLPFAPGSRWPWLRAIIGWTSISTLSLWPWLGPKALFSVLPVTTVVELWFRMRLRVVMECEHCGFDPFLYVRSRDQAIAKVKAHLEKARAARIDSEKPAEKSATSSEARPNARATNATQ